MSAVPPNRPNADHQGDICVEGSKFAHESAADTAPAKVSTLSPTPGMIADSTAGTGGICDCSEAYIDSGSPHTDWQTAFHGDGTGEKWQGGPQDMLTVQTFTPSGTFDARTCHKKGFKAVMAKRVWHGDFDFIQRGNPSIYDTVTMDAATATWTFGPTRSESVVNKYLTLSVDMTTSFDDGVHSYAGHQTSDCTIDDNGIYTQSGSDTSTWPGNDPVTVGGAWAFFIALDWNSVAEYFCRFTQFSSPDMGSDGYVTGTAGGCALHTGSTGPHGDFVIEQISANLSSGSYTRSVYYWDAGAGAALKAYDEICSVNAETVSYEFLTPSPLAYHYEFTKTLSSPNGYGNVVADLVELAGYWNLADDVQYPWRDDPYFGIMPFVERREVLASVVPFANYVTQPTDPNIAAGFDGEIIGKPMSSGGGGWFDFYATYWRICQTDPGCVPAYINYIYAYGGMLSDHHVSTHDIEVGAAFSTFLPPCTTHWTNNEQMQTLPPCAFLDCKTWFLDNAIYLCKTAHARPDTYPSINFARPCGDDKYQIDEPTAKAVLSVAGTVLTLDSAFASVTGKTLLVALGDPALDGIYTGSTLAGSDLTLGMRMGDLPDGYDHCETYFTTTPNVGMVGILRWPSAAACSGQWDDVSTKGDCRLGGWFTDGRDSGNNTFECANQMLPFSQCYPSVICFSPNGETWPSVQTPDGVKSVGRTLWFGTGNLPDFVADAEFGSSVQASVEWSCTDPFYQTPICGGTAPQVEARCDSVLATGYGGGAASNEQPPAFAADSLGQTPAWPAMSQPVPPAIL